MGVIFDGPGTVERLDSLGLLTGETPPDGSLRLTELPNLRWTATSAEETGSPAHVRDIAAMVMAGEQISDVFLARVESEVHSSDPATIIYTSGSTSDPKGVIHTHDSVMTRTTELAHEFSLGPLDRVLTTMPSSGSAGWP